MSKGLKQMVEEAMGQAVEKPAPVQISDEARRALSMKMREWSGWTNSTVQFGDPSKDGSPFASCNHITRVFTVNVDRLVLNPNRVLLTVTPFRLRQEAVLTGILMHEAGHARHSHWLPRDEAEAKVRPCLHSDGTTPSRQAIALALLMEEPRVEGLMARNADRIGASGLGWTMRASAAHLVPMTALSANPDQKIMDLITSWALRAGRQYAIHYWHADGPRLRHWVQDFTTLLSTVLVEHLTVVGPEGNAPDIAAKDAIDTLIEMTHCTDDIGPSMVDMARDVLTILFPETEDDEDGPMPGGGCTMPEPEQEPEEQEPEQEPEQEQPGEGEGEGEPEAESESGEGGEGDESGEQGKGDTEPEDEGSGTEPGAGDSGEDEPSDEEGEEQSGATPSTEETDTDSPLAQALADMEDQSKSETEEEVEEQEEAEEAKGAGAGSGQSIGGGWRNPTKEEREVQKGAERFLRHMIEPSEASTVSLTDTPSATVDGAALAAWKAGGQTSAPNFFRRTRRSVEPSPPVRIAVLVDVSSSMEELQKPSAILSWALASAALDLRNFAGRGQQVESCLIHWGSSARVIQRNGVMLPGIREWECNEGTSAMGEALDLVEEEMPGFFDISETPVNRLLVQFTDWELFGGSRRITARIQQTLASGVNMLTVAPQGYSPRRSNLDSILAECKVQRGRPTLLKYNEVFPNQVWETAAQALS